LLIDYELANIEVISVDLSRMGNSTTAANDPADAVRALEADFAESDVVVTDQTMPGLSGLDLARKINRLGPDLPVILCTGFGEAFDKQIGHKAGADAYLRKLLDAGTPARCIRRLRDRSAYT
jgi:CheY-like chemotaxis protein